MRRITFWLLSTIAALVLLFSYRTSTVGSGTAAASGTGTDTDSTDDSSSSTTTTTTTSGSGTSYTGSVAQTRWGPVQVRITVSGGKVVKAEAVQVPTGDHRDEEINSYAVPILNQETVKSQTAEIDTVSGATVTSDGYRESLQAALDAANLK